MITLNALCQSHALHQLGDHTRSPYLHMAKRLLGVSGMVALALWGVYSFPSQAQGSSMSQLGVEIQGLRNQNGQVCLSLFASSQGFPNDSDQAVQNQCVTASNSAPLVTFDNVQPGSYAIAVLHDANSDRTINRNLFGIPNEGFGFSGNPAIRTGPPTFGESLVVVAGGQTNIQINLNYF